MPTIAEQLRQRKRAIAYYHEDFEKYGDRARNPSGMGSYRKVCCDCRQPIYVKLLSHKRCPECWAKNELTRHHRAKVEVACVACSTIFAQTRSDAKFCSAACRQRMYRCRVTAKSL